MKLSDIRPARGAVKKRKRIGCGPGSGHGKTATKGHKGQKARSGGSIPPYFEGGQMPLQRRVPKRGFTNIFKTRYQVVAVDRLNQFGAGAKIDREALLDARLVRRSSLPVKILGGGELKVALEVEVDAVSRSAVKAIRDAGGTVRLSGGAALPVPESGTPSEGAGTAGGAQSHSPTGTAADESEEERR
jgi:large subunit ribosomal protein L15